MDVQTGLVCIGVVVISAAVILLVSMFDIKEKSYEEAIAEQRKLPNDLLLSKKDKGKEKKHKNKAGKKVKEKKEEKDEKEEKLEHVQFEENPQILPLEPLARKENLHQIGQSEPVANKSPKETPTKSKKNAKDAVKKKDENSKDEKKEEKKEANVNSQIVTNKEAGKEVKDQQKETPVKEAKEVKESAPSNQNKESKKAKKKNDILAQIGGDKDAVDVSLLDLFIQKAELSRSEIQILIDKLLNKQLDNPSEHSEWSEGRADPVIKLKKQLAEKEKALADEHEASVAFQTKLKELRTELNSERSRLSASVRQLEEALNAKVTEAQTLHTRMQHILESHAAEKQGFARQIEQLQSKVNEDAAIIHKMQEDQGQTQGHLQQELIAQRKQMEVQFAQTRENENALKAQLAQKHAEVQDLQNQLQATCDSSTAEIEMLRQQLGIMQGQLMHSEEQFQHFKEVGDSLQDVARQLQESHSAHADLDYRLKNSQRHEQELQKQVNSLQAELNLAKTEVTDVSTLKSELTKAQSEIAKLKSELSVSVNEAKSEAVEITALKTALANKEAELMKSQDELNSARLELQQSEANAAQLEAQLGNLQKECKTIKVEFGKVTEGFKKAQGYQTEMQRLQDELGKARAQLKMTNEIANEANLLKVEINRLEGTDKKSGEAQLQITRLQEEVDRLSAQLTEVQNEVKQLQEENESLASQLAATTERPAAEGRENGIDDKVQKNNVQLVEHANLLAQKEGQLNALKTELTHKETELTQLNAQVDALRRDVNNEHSLAGRLQDELEAQRSKNNELRIKNWKVMEALSAAESRAKPSYGKNFDEVTEKIKVEQEELTKAFLQRIFPEIKISEKSHDQWLRSFEEKVFPVLTELRKKNTVDSLTELEKQNKNLQDMVSHYKQIIDDTEGMLNKLQSHVESEETRWQSQLRQKENEVANLRIELGDVMSKLNANEQLNKKILELESRLAEAESHKASVDSELSVLRNASKSIPVGGTHASELAALEKLQEEKARLSEELQLECNKRATLDTEVTKLRSLVETSETSLAQEKDLVTQLQREVCQLKNEICGSCSCSEQSTINGPATSESPKFEPPLARQTLIAAIESTLLKNTEFENCSMTKPNLVQSQQEIDNSPLTTKYSSKSCHVTEHNTQASWNPLIGQQHKKHKKKRKGGSGKK